MPYPRAIVTVFIIILIVIVSSELANGFMKLGSNHLLLKPHKRNVSFYKNKWIEQPLDHFNSSEKRTLKLEYLDRLDFWKPNGPIYIFMSQNDVWNEKWRIASENKSLICQMAKDTNGALFATEHRYFGNSKPDIPNQNMTEYYKYLSSRQALADVAYLIRSVKSDPKYKSSKVIVVGISYMGNLAAWLREFYPDLVDAALAASAPVLAQKDFKEFYEGVIYTLGKYGSQKCLNDIERYFKRCEKLLQSSDGIETLKNELNICPSSNLTILENQQWLFYTLLHGRMNVVAIAYPSKIKQICKEYEPRDMFTVDLVKRTRSIPLSKDCFPVNFNGTYFEYPWIYQSCTEFGHFRTTTSEKKPFIHWTPLDFNLKFCKGLFKGDVEKIVDEGVARTNKMYGGKHPNVTKVVFTHGDMDPWHALGVLQDLGPDAPAIMINGTAERAVLEIGPDDPEELKKSRNYIKDLIKKWISTP